MEVKCVFHVPVLPPAAASTHACIVAAVALIVAGLQKAVQHQLNPLPHLLTQRKRETYMHFGEMLWVVSLYVHLFAQMKIKMFRGQCTPLKYRFHDYPKWNETK